MINLIRADYYRLIKSKTFKVALTLFSISFIMMSFLLLGDEKNLSVSSIGTENGFFFGKLPKDSIELAIVKNSLAFTIIIFIILLFVIADMVINRYKNGTIKNTLAYGESRIKVYISNFLVINLTMIFFTITVFFMAFIISNFILNKGFNIDIETIKILLKSTLMIIILLAASISFYMLIGTMIKSSTVITALGILGWVFLPVFFAEKIFVGENPSIILMFVREIAGNPMNTEKWLFFILVSVISIVVFLLVGIKTFEKQDI